MEALRRGWDSLLSAPEVRKEEDAINLALALSLSEEEQRLQEEQDHYHAVLYDANLGSQRPRSCRAEQREAAVAELPRKLRASLERALAEEEQMAHDAVLAQSDDNNNSPTTLPELDPQDAERLSSPRLLSLGADFDEKMQRIASAFDLSSLRSAFSPRVNADEDEPNEDALSRSLRRLQRRLNKFTLVEYTISGDGNCQFASLSDQLYRTPKMQGVVRRLVVQQLTDFPEHYSRFVPGDYKFYCWKMSQNHVWGDHLTLQAAADRYGIQISLITSYKNAPYMHIMPREIKSCRILWLSFFGELHYNSLYTEEDIELRRRMDENNAGCTLF